MHTSTTSTTTRTAWERTIRSAGIGPTPLAVAMTLATFGTEGQGCRPSQSTLAEGIGVSTRTVRRALATLVQDGWVRKVGETDRLVAIYDIAVPVARDLDAGVLSSITTQDTGDLDNHPTPDTGGLDPRTPMAKETNTSKGFGEVEVSLSISPKPCLSQTEYGADDPATSVQGAVARLLADFEHHLAKSGQTPMTPGARAEYLAALPGLLAEHGEQWVLTLNSRLAGEPLRLLREVEATPTPPPLPASPTLDPDDDEAARRARLLSYAAK